MLNKWGTMYPIKCLKKSIQMIFFQTINDRLTAHNWQKCKRLFLTFPAIKFIGMKQSV